MLFSDLRLSEPLLRSIASEGYVTATPIQEKAIPPALEGRDVLGCAQTGTGKTAAFALPILHRLSSIAASAGPRRVRCLVLCPTRELATQIADSFRVYGRHLGIRSTVVFGGVGQNPQVAMLRSGVEILIATPGRLLDLMNQGLADLRGVEVLVLDEADRMLDMGFIQDIRRITAKLSAKRQTMLFSATMPREIRSLADSLMHNAVAVQVAPVAATADGVNQSVYFVDKRNKPELLAHLVDHLPMTRAIVFTRTKHGADRVVRHLHSRGIRAEAIHGNKSQNARERALANFKASKTPVLVATDIASRGIDVDAITHVVNYDLTHEPETYVHRIGRTARAGATGAAVSFCDKDEMSNLKAIERLIRKPIPVRNDHPAYSPSGSSSPAVHELVHGYRSPHAHGQSRQGGRGGQERQERQGGQGAKARHPGPRQNAASSSNQAATPPAHPLHRRAQPSRDGAAQGSSNRPQHAGKVKARRGAMASQGSGRRRGF